MAINLIVPSSPVPALRDVVKTLPVRLYVDPLGEDFNNVVLNIDVSKPDGSSVALMATDTTGTTFDLVKTHHWGPVGGFPAPAGYDATTNVSGIFSKVSNDYVITITLTANGTVSGPVTLTSPITVHVSESDVSQKILVKRGLSSALPAKVTAYELLYAYDTRELFIANASGIPEKVTDIFVGAEPALERRVNNLLWLDTTTNTLKRWDTTLTTPDWVVAANVQPHTHPISDIINLQTILNDLQDQLDDKAPLTHNHDDRYYTEGEIDIKLAAKSDVGHTHVISEVSGLQGALDDKSNIGHTHTEADITDLDKYTKAEVNTMLAVVDGGTF